MLVQVVAPPPAKLLDVGCGTGRHLVPLAKLGYDVMGIDINSEMLSKIPSDYNVHEMDITDPEFNSKLPEAQFDLIISMWNAFNEYALDESSARQALQNMRRHLKPQGKILLNIEDAAEMDVEQLNYAQHIERDGTTLDYTSNVIAFNPTTKISTCIEQLTVLHTDREPEVFSGEITQRWWRIDEIIDLLRNNELTLRHTHRIPVNTELYLEIQQLD